MTKLPPDYPYMRTPADDLKRAEALERQAARSKDAASSKKAADLSVWYRILAHMKRKRLH